MPGPVARVVAVVVTITLVAGGVAHDAAAAGAASPEPVVYRPPVDAPVVERFRPPADPFGPGKLGVGYATDPGTPVRSAGPGTVAFAGQVGGRLHVVVLHPDGIRTSYSFLASIAVRRGQRVEAGDVVGTTGDGLHFGARAGDAYVDPLVLLGGGARDLRLVPDGDRRPATEARERGALRRFLGAVGRAAVAAAGGVAAAADDVAAVGGAAVTWAGREAMAVAEATRLAEVVDWLSATGLLPGSMWMRGLRLTLAAKAWFDSRATCTPTDVRPTRSPGRRLLVLVAGLGSTSEHAAVDRLDTRALGYAPADVVRFSYRGGTTAERSYTAADTQVDLAVSGRRLRDLLEHLQSANPGVPLDVVAHSQGGLVARAALGARAPLAVRTLVTLGTPHHGSDLATVAALPPITPQLAVVQAIAARVRPAGIEPGSPAVAQLGEASPFIRRLERSPLPAGVAVTSIAARADLVVPSPRSHLGGAANAVVTTGDWDQHQGLPAAPAARRAVALALAGMAPSCESFADAMADAAVGEAVTAAEDAATAFLAVGRMTGATPAVGRSGDRRGGG